MPPAGHATLLSHRQVLANPQRVGEVSGWGDSSIFSCFQPCTALLEVPERFRLRSVLCVPEGPAEEAAPWPRSNGTPATRADGASSIGTTPDGAHRRQPQTTKGGFATKAEAEAWVARMVVGKQDGSWVDPAAGRMSYAEWAQVGWRHRGLTCGRRPTTGMPTTSADM